MARYFGTVGYAKTEETRPGIFEEVVTEKDYYGDVTRNIRRWERGEHLNDNVEINNMISIVADAYAFLNFGYIRYVSWMGEYWKVTNVEVQRPRLILTIGGVYNGPKRESP